MKRLLAALALGLPLAAAAQRFAPVATYSVGGRSSNPRRVATGDFNQDGYPDLATANYADLAAGILLGSATGTFGPVVPYPLGDDNTPYDLAVGDLNRDGHLDLVTANYTGGSVGVLLGRGDGTFGPAALFAAGGTRYPASVAVLDVNGDGYPDVLTANLGSPSVSVWLGQGSGGLALTTTYPLASAASSISLAVGDVNQDGRPDIAVAAFSGAGRAVSVLLGQGGGTFAAPVLLALPAGSEPYDLAIGDVTRDGRPDLVVGDLAGNRVLVLPGQAAGGFGAAVAYATGPGSQPYGVALADLNGDAFADIVTGNLGTSTVGLLLSAPDGTFAAPQAYSIGAGSEPGRVGVADLNQDGRPDLLAANTASGTCAVLLAVAPLATARAAPLPASVFPNPSADGQLQLVLPLPEVPAPTAPCAAELRDALGRVVRNWPLPSPTQPLLDCRLTTQGLPGGSYLLLISVGTWQVAHRVVLE